MAERTSIKMNESQQMNIRVMEWIKVREHHLKRMNQRIKTSDENEW